MTDRFDLEQQIMICWGITEDIKALEEAMDKHDMSRDEIGNYLLGLRSIYELKFNKMWDQFEELLHDKKIL